MAVCTWRSRGIRAAWSVPRVRCSGVQERRRLGGRQASLGPGADLGVSEEQHAADQRDQDPDDVAVDLAPVIQAVQDGGCRQADPADGVPLVAAGDRKADEVAGEARPAGMADGVSQEPPDEVQDEVEHRADKGSE